MEGINELKAISFFSTSLHTMESIEEVLWDVTKNVIHKLGLVDCVIYEYDEQQNLLVQKAAYGEKNPAGRTIYNQISINPGEGIVGYVAQTMNPELVSDTSKDARYIIDDQKRYSEICVPIIVGDKLFGVIDCEHPAKGFFTELHLYLFNIIATLCAQRIKELRAFKKKTFSKENTYYVKLEELMREKKVYRNPHLSLASAADMLGISASYLSSMVNAIRQESFIDFINGYRVKEAKTNLRSQHYKRYTILSIGLEAGFNSKSTFYKAFKKCTGMSPSSYREHYHFSILSELNFSDFHNLNTLRQLHRE
ncbi:MAG: helix-turn-helix domain-containing protein [Bacteroidota bacterium]